MSETLAAAMKAHRAAVRKEWQDSHRDDPEYSDIAHLCSPDCAAAILAALPDDAVLVTTEALEAVGLHVE